VHPGVVGVDLGWILFAPDDDLMTKPPFFEKSKPRETVSQLASQRSSFGICVFVLMLFVDVPYIFDTAS
jgi:hypothetical protein